MSIAREVSPPLSLNVRAPHRLIIGPTPIGNTEPRERMLTLRNVRDHQSFSETRDRDGSAAPWSLSPDVRSAALSGFCCGHS